MPNLLRAELQTDFLSCGFSRRDLGRLAALLTAGASLPFYGEHALAQNSKIGPLPADAVRLNANENPLGPCSEAIEAMFGAVRNGCRYQYEQGDVLAATLAETEGLSPDRVAPFAGSSDPLHRVVVAFTSPSRGLVVADTTYESPEKSARFIGAKVTRVPLTKDYAHDLRAMAQADPNAGVIYVCNPNNPTGTVTPRAEIERLLEAKPKGAIVLLDEAYIHFSTVKPCLDLVAAGKDLIVLRTFSKIYGMAGLRAGAAFGRPDLLDKILPLGANIFPTTGMAGALASLRSKNLVVERRKINPENREDTLRFLSRHGYAVTPSVSNKFMVDVRRSGPDVARALAAEKIFVGRSWPTMPNHIRVTVGTHDEMQKFQAALLKVMG